MNDREERMGSTDDPSVLARQSYLDPAVALAEFRGGEHGKGH